MMFMMLFSSAYKRGVSTIHIRPNPYGQTSQTRKGPWTISAEVECKVKGNGAQEHPQQSKRNQNMRLLVVVS
jgi:hypothetical protein